MSARLAASFLLCGGNVEQVLNLNHRVVAIGRQEVDGAMLAHGVAHDVFEFAHRTHEVGAHFDGHVVHAFHAAVPHDVVDVDFVAEERALARVGINHAYEPVAMMGEEIEKRTVLAKFISIGGIIHRALVVSEEHDEAVSHLLGQRATARNVGFFREKHIF